VNHRNCLQPPGQPRKPRLRYNYMHVWHFQQYKALSWTTPLSSFTAGRRPTL